MLGGNADLMPLKWKLGRTIGRGSFGTVYIGLDMVGGTLLAVKRLFVDPSASGDDSSGTRLSDLEREIDVMKSCNHPNIVRYYGSHHEPGKGDPRTQFYVFMEYVSGGSVVNMLKDFGPFTEQLARRYAFQVLNGLSYLHSCKIIHNDVKGANILITESGTAKLGDFGCSRRLRGLQTLSFGRTLDALQGSLPWMSPETVRQAGRSRKADMWSFGITVIEMLTGKPPFWSEADNGFALILKLGTLKTPPTPPHHISQGMKQLIGSCLKIDKDARCTASELLDQPFMRQFRGSYLLNQGHNPAETGKNGPKLRRAASAGNEYAMNRRGSA